MTSLASARTASSLSSPRISRPNADVVDHPPVRQQAEVLEDHRDLVAADAPAAPRVDIAATSLAVESDPARGRLDEPGQAAHQRRLAGAGQAHDDEDLARRDVERDVLDRGDAAGPLQHFGRGRSASGVPMIDPRLRAEDLPQSRHRQPRLRVDKSFAGHDLPRPLRHLLRIAHPRVRFAPEERGRA